MNRRPQVAEMVAKFADTMPLGRLAEPDEIRPGSVLLGPLASYMTGVDLLGSKPESEVCLIQGGR